MEDIDKRLRQILQELVSEDEAKAEVVMNKEVIDLAEDLEFDSLMIISFMVLIEEEFNVDFEKENTIDIVWEYEELKKWLKEKSMMM